MTVGLTSVSMPADVRCIRSMMSGGPHLSRVEFTFNILSKGPQQVETQTQDDVTIVTAAKGYEEEDDGDQETDQSEPPAKDQGPEEVANR